MSDVLIGNLSKYVKLKENEVESILSLFHAHTFSRKEFIVRSGEAVRSESLIISGLTRSYERDRRGMEHTLDFGITDCWAGNLYSFLTNQPSRFDVECLEDTAVYQISRPQLELLYQQVPKMERHFRIMAQNAFINLTEKLLTPIKKSATERYEDFLVRYPKLSERVHNNQIASLLGITPQSLSRIRARKVR